jgi:hypothetical protein
MNPEKPLAPLAISADYRQADLRACYQPQGVATAGELADMINVALEAARVGGKREMLISIVGMTGFESPGPAFRRWAVHRWSNTIKGKLRIAIVARAEHICPAKTGLLVAAEEGLDAYISDNEVDAAAWLDR